jgi:hypothetical protein
MHFYLRLLNPVSLAFTAILFGICCGCSFFPEVRHKQSLHNPFPQLKQIAVLPFYNQSNEPTLDGEVVAAAYYAELQAIPGFEVIPVGVARNLLIQYSRTFGEPQTGTQFQQLAQFMGVEAVVVGSVTDYEAYYPPRMAMTVHWYAANPGYHPVPPGYGLPWGTKAEKRIPRRIVEEAEFELAREQLATQAPKPEPPPGTISDDPIALVSNEVDGTRADGTGISVNGEDVSEAWPLPETGVVPEEAFGSGLEPSVPLPEQWPDPTGLIPDPPSPAPPALVAQSKPVLTHTRLYRGDDVYVTDRLADYVNNEDDARTGGWQSYLNRSNDFIRFCCHLHLAEMFESRGGGDQSDLILRWPIGRY